MQHSFTPALAAFALLSAIVCGCQKRPPDAGTGEPVLQNTDLCVISEIETVTTGDSIVTEEAQGNFSVQVVRRSPGRDDLVADATFALEMHGVRDALPVESAELGLYRGSVHYLVCSMKRWRAEVGVVVVAATGCRELRLSPSALFKARKLRLTCEPGFVAEVPSPLAQSNNGLNPTACAVAAVADSCAGLAPAAGYAGR